MIIRLFFSLCILHLRPLELNMSINRIVFILIVLMLPSVSYSLDFSGDNYLMVNTDRLRLRSEPTLGSRIVSVLDQEDKVVLLERGEMDSIDSLEAPWIKVFTDDSRLLGWVFSGYISDTEEPVDYGDEGPFNRRGNIQSGLEYNRSSDNTYLDEFSLPLLFAKRATRCLLQKDDVTIDSVQFKPSPYLKSTCFNIDLSDYPEGNHIFTVSAYDANTLLATREFEIDKYEREQNLIDGYHEDLFEYRKKDSVIEILELYDVYFDQDSPEMPAYRPDLNTYVMDLDGEYQMRISIQPDESEYRIKELPLHIEILRGESVAADYELGIWEFIADHECYGVGPEFHLFDGGFVITCNWPFESPRDMLVFSKTSHSLQSVFDYFKENKMERYNYYFDVTLEDGMVIARNLKSRYDNYTPRTYYFSLENGKFIKAEKIP